MNDPSGGVASGMGTTCGLVGPIGVYAGWVADVASGAKAAITAMDWAAMVLICFLLPGVLTWAFGLVLRRVGWIEGDLKLDRPDGTRILCLGSELPQAQSSFRDKPHRMEDGRKEVRPMGMIRPGRAPPHHDGGAQQPDSIWRVRCGAV